MLPSPVASPARPEREKPKAPATGAGLLVRQALLGLLIATVLVLLLLFAGSEDRGFIYIDF